MGRKIPYDTALRLAKTAPNDSIFAPPNKYGYQININHPKIRPLYERYKKKVGEIILSDQQWFEFEGIIINMIERGKNEQDNTHRTPDR